SSAQNDSGMFELNFRDDRYPPCEGAGVISSWSVELTRDRNLRQFDYDTIADVILHLRYTAREDQGDFRQAAVDHLNIDILPSAGTDLPLLRLFDLKHEFPTQWYALFHPVAGSPHVLELPIRGQHFPVFAQEKTIELQAITIVARTDDNTALTAQLDPPIGSGAANEIALDPAVSPALFQVGTSQNLSPTPLDETQPWKLQLTDLCRVTWTVS
ncbi:MAG: hypothetical protein ABI988_13070, partial [Nitrospirota bacterium]